MVKYKIGESASAVFVNRGIDGEKEKEQSLNAKMTLNREIIESFILNLSVTAVAFPAL
jgi:ribosomal protein S6